MILRLTITIFILSILVACNKSAEVNNKNTAVVTDNTKKNSANDSVSIKADTTINTKNIYESVSDSEFVVMNNYARNFFYDMKYTTKDNFLKKAVYSCDQCLLRKEVADALQKANESLLSRGLSIKFFDCYRPLDVQKQMWEIYPDARYVGNPNTTGSVHNKGCAVDITLVDKNGKELDMGTAFDHFGNEAHHAYRNLPDTIVSNRKLLKETMETFGFSPITSEWWHYNFKSRRKYSLSNFRVTCNEGKNK